MSPDFELNGNSLQVDFQYDVRTELYYIFDIDYYYYLADYDVNVDWNNGEFTYTDSGPYASDYDFVPVSWNHAFDVSSDGAYLLQIDLTGDAYLVGGPYGEQHLSYNVVVATHATTAQTITGLDIPDIVYGSKYGDTISVSGGQNEVNGGAGDDVITGGSESDNLKGGTGADTMTGGNGDDSLDGGTGADIMSGGAGADTYYVHDAGDQVIEDALPPSQQGSDVVYAYVSFTVANVEVLALKGSGDISGTGDGNANGIVGNGGKNTLSGMGGNDTLDGKAGADTMIGGDGDDRYTVDNVGDTVIETAGGGSDVVYSSVSFSVPDHVESMWLTGSADISGAGSVGDDFVLGNFGNNLITGGDGNDFLRGDKGNDTLEGGAGDDTLRGDDGSDTASYAGAASGVTVDLSITLAQDTKGAGVDTLVTVENLTGSTHNDVLRGNSLANVLEGGAGADRMEGGKGNDIYWIDNAGDKAVEQAGGGTDLVSSTVALTMGAEIEQLTLAGTADIYGMGNDLGNTILGNAGSNALSGKGGNDWIDAGDGDDKLIGGDGDDYLTGGAGDDSFRWSAGADSYLGGFGTDLLDFSAASGATIFLAGGGTNAGAAAGQQAAGIEKYLGSETGVDFVQGGVEDDAFWGNGGNDTLIGLGGIDNLRGGDGDDRLSGGAGADVLRGEAGEDTFAFDSALASAGRDRIVDFETGMDTLEIDASVFGGGLVAGGSVDLVANGNPSTAGHAGATFLYNIATGMLSFDADGGGAGAGVTFAWLQLAPSLAASDFAVVA